MGAMKQFNLLAAVVALISLLLGSSPARGEATFSLEPLESGSYAITAAGLANLAALDFTISYDPKTLRNPRLTKGPFVPGDASFIVNTAISGELRLLVIRSREIAGDGVIATIAFDLVEGKTPRIILFKSNPISVAAAPAEARDRTVSPPVVAPPSAEIPAIDRAPTVVVKPVPVRDAPPLVTAPVVPVAASAGTTTSGGQLYLGKVTMPGDVPLSANPATPAEAARDLATPAVAAGGRPERHHPPERAGTEREATQSAGEKKQRLERYPNLPERFRDFAGERTLAELSALFAGREGRVTQEPAIVVADGATTVTIRVPPMDGGDETPAFLLEKARLVTLLPDDGGWLVTVLPERGASQARLTMRTETVLIDFPLVVVPPWPVAGTDLPLSAAGLKRFLVERGTDKAPRHDLNGDGIRDYLDEYFFMAHLLRAQAEVK